MELQQTNKNQSVSITTKEDLSKALYHFNYLTSFPYSDLVLEGWANSIIELEPAITPEIIKWITDKMKVGLIDFDAKKGIQNIFVGFRVYIDLKLLNVASPETPKWSKLYQKYRKEYLELTATY